MSGVRGENSVKIFGPDLAELVRLSKSVKNEIAAVPGVTDPGVFNLLGQPNLVIRTLVAILRRRAPSRPTGTRCAIPSRLHVSRISSDPAALLLFYDLDQLIRG